MLIAECSLAPRASSQSLFRFECPPSVPCSGRGAYPTSQASVPTGTSYFVQNERHAAVIDIGDSARGSDATISPQLDIRLTFAHTARMAITRRQRELYDFLSRFVAENGYSPSYEEIKVGMGLSSLATVHKHVTNLEKKQLLTRDYNRSRSIDLLPPKGKLKQSMSVNRSEEHTSELQS